MAEPSDTSEADYLKRWLAGNQESMEEYH